MNFMSIRNINFLKGETVIIYGYGIAGNIILEFFRSHNVSNSIVFCDRDINKINKKNDPQVIPIEEAVQIENSIVVVGFLGNDIVKIESALATLQRFGVERVNVNIIDMVEDFSTDIFKTQMSLLIEKYIAKMDISKAESDKKIVFLSYGFDADKEKNGGGGPIGAICMQKKYIGEKWHDYVVSYPYYSKDTIRIVADKRPWISNAILKAIEYVTEYGKQHVYVANDIFSAYGLSLCGVSYALIYHGQGDMVKEMTLWGNKLSDKEKEFIYDLEKKAVGNAKKVFFPSRGAELFFRDSFGESINFESQYPLYNTIISYSEKVLVNGIGRRDDVITFFSTGQMTELKGMDRVPAFLKEYARNTSKPIRWIVVADGVLKYSVKQAMEEIKGEGFDIEYVNIDYRIPHGQMLYLMSISDVYIMLHRVSIFDFATLEAMYSGLPVILSNIPGNIEYNVDDNILLVDDDYDWDRIFRYMSSRLAQGEKNKGAYQKYFSSKPFMERYNRFLEQLI